MRTLLHNLRTRVLAGWIPEGSLGLRLLGHRLYVGGRWDELGQLQFETLRQEGLQPSDCLLDIACGALRGGRLFIDYLEPGNYLGIDQEQDLLDRGVERELESGVYDAKRPKLIASSTFEFERFARQPDMALAFSLFTHLAEKDIRLCLTNLRAVVSPGHRFLATYFDGEATNPAESHSLDHFEYTPEWFRETATPLGWTAERVDSFRHPREQSLMRFVST